MYEELTAFLTKLPRVSSFGEWSAQPPEADGSPEHPFIYPHVNYDQVVTDFRRTMLQFSLDCRNLFRSSGDPDDSESDEDPDADKEEEENDENISRMSGPAVLNKIDRALNAERFCDGLLLSLFKDGTMEALLRRLKEIDGERPL